MCAFLDWAIFFTELFKSAAKPHARKIIKMLSFNNFNIERVPNKLKSVTACRKLVREKAGLKLEKLIFEAEGEKRRERIFVRLFYTGRKWLRY